MAKIADILFANDAPLAIIAGPCMIEPTLFETAVRIKAEAQKRNLPLVFKASFDKANRQSISSPRGVGLQAGLEALREVKSKLGLPILTDIHLPEEAEQVAEVADCIQIPAFLCRQTDLIVAAARTGKTVNIKKGQFMAPGQMLSIVEKARSSGARDIIVTERGTSFGYNDLVFDPRSLEIMKEFAAVVFDVSHSVQRPGAMESGRSGSSGWTGSSGSGGDRRFIPTLARAAVAVGIAGLFIETHPDPASASSDRQTQWRLDDFGALMDHVVAIDTAAKKILC